MMTLSDKMLNEIRYGYTRGNQDNRSMLRDSNFSAFSKWPA